MVMGYYRRFFGSSQTNLEGPHIQLYNHEGIGPIIPSIVGYFGA